MALISAIDGLSLLYQRLQTKLHYGFCRYTWPLTLVHSQLVFFLSKHPSHHSSGLWLFIRYRIVVLPFVLLITN